MTSSIMPRIIKMVRTFDQLTDIFPIVSTVKNGAIWYYQRTHKVAMDAIGQPSKASSSTSWKDDVKIHMLSKSHLTIFVSMVPIFGNLIALMRFVVLTVKRHLRHGKARVEENLQISKVGRDRGYLYEAIVERNWGCKKHHEEILNLYIARNPNVSLEKLERSLQLAAKAQNLLAFTQILGALKQRLAIELKGMQDESDKQLIVSRVNLAVSQALVVDGQIVAKGYLPDSLAYFERVISEEYKDLLGDVGAIAILKQVVKVSSLLNTQLVRGITETYLNLPETAIFEVFVDSIKALQSDFVIEFLCGYYVRLFAPNPIPDEVILTCLLLPARLGDVKVEEGEFVEGDWYYSIPAKEVIELLIDKLGCSPQQILKTLDTVTELCPKAYCTQLMYIHKLTPEDQKPHIQRIMAAIESTDPAMDPQDKRDILDFLDYGFYQNADFSDIKSAVGGNSAGNETTYVMAH